MNNEIGYRPTWAEIDLNNLKHNFSAIKKRIPRSTRVMATVKADAYGHGLIPVSRSLESCGADFLGVASIDEGIKLREAGITVPILLLGLIFKKDVKAAFEYSLSVTICDKGLALALDEEGRSLARRINVHVKVDTGMGRLGVLHNHAFELIKDIHKLKFVNIEGIFTHFAFADMDRDFTLLQIDLLNKVIAKLRGHNIRIPLVHAANSMGIIGYRESHLNMVRPGLIIYGLHPKENLQINLKPVLSLKTRVVFIKELPAGAGVSYCHEYVTKKATRIATLPIGYGDGYPRNLSNLAPVLINGKHFKISGLICMDQTMVDIADSPVKVGDEVVLIGAQGKNKISAEELASLAGTIPYEIVCGLGSRIPRVYLNQAKR